MGRVAAGAGRASPVTNVSTGAAAPHLQSPAMDDKVEFRNRAHEVSRLEAFSDVIFGFAISLLVVSLEAPKNFEELMEMMHGMLPFALCFFVFIDLWFEHHHFSRRYALEDRPTMIINTLLLFVVLFYVYPLRFALTMLARSFTGERQGLTHEQAITMFTIYGFGFLAVFTILGAMYLHAWRKREALQLNEVERLMTMESVVDNFSTAAFGLLSILVARSGFPQYAGILYFFLAVPKTIVPTIYGRKKRLAAARLASAPETARPDAPEGGPDERERGGADGRHHRPEMV
jgi:uncharacterized membrane protein